MAKNTKVSHPIVLVLWNDAESIDAWTHSSEVDCGTTTVESVGFLINEDEKALTLALNYDSGNDCYSCIIKVPTGMISKKIKLKI